MGEVALSERVTAERVDLAGAKKQASLAAAIAREVLRGIELQTKLEQIVAQRRRDELSREGEWQAFLAMKSTAASLTLRSSVAAVARFLLSPGGSAVSSDKVGHGSRR